MLIPLFLNVVVISSTILFTLSSPERILRKKPSVSYFCIRNFNSVIPRDISGFSPFLPLIHGNTGTSAFTSSLDERILLLSIYLNDITANGIITPSIIQKTAYFTTSILPGAAASITSGLFFSI